MKYNRFEDLPVWKAAIDLALRVYELTKDHAFDRAGDLRDQLRRASLSISNNVAEGFERGTTPELLYFLYIARGSAGEARSMLRFCERWPATGHLKSEISNQKSEISDLISLAESCSRQIRAWADSLQNSDIAGQRHLNEQSRRLYESKKRSAAFAEHIEAVVHARIDEQLARSRAAQNPGSAHYPRPSDTAANASNPRPDDAAGRSS